MSSGIQAVAAGEKVSTDLKRSPTPFVHPMHPSMSPAWDEFVLRTPGGTFFHLSAWMKIIQETFGFAPQHLCAEVDGRITGILPLFWVKNWIAGRCLLSTPFSVYGGICAQDPQSEAALLEYAKNVACEEQVDYLELRQRDGNPYPDFHANSLYATFTKELTANPEENFKRLPNDTRYMIRRARRSGLTVRRGLDQMEIFYRLFSMNMHHHGTPMFPRSLFRNIETELRTGIFDLLITYLGEEPIAGVLSFFHRDTVLPYYAGLGPKANKLAANNLMYWELMTYAAEAGYRRFDFGRSKKGTGAFYFKSQWNMDIRTLNYGTYLVRRKEVPNVNPLNPKFNMATKAWQKLPLWAANLAGPHIVKWFP